MQWLKEKVYEDITKKWLSKANNELKVIRNSDFIRRQLNRLIVLF